MHRSLVKFQRDSDAEMSRNHTCTNPHLKDVVQVSDDGALWEVIDLWSCLWAWIWRKGVVDKLNFTVPRYENNEISPEICYLEISLPLYILQIPHQAQCTTIQIKLGWALFVTYTIIQSIMRSEMCSLHLTHPSVHTWSSGQPTVQRPGSSRGLPVGAGIRTHNLPLVSGFKSNALSIRPTTARSM